MDYQERRRQQFLRTERTILQAAADLSRQDGFDQVSVRDICRRAGITTGAFYHHFPSKEALLVQGFASLDAYMEASMEEHLADPPLSRLHLLLFHYAGFFESQGRTLVSRYYQHRLTGSSPASMSPTRYTLRSMLSCLEEVQSAGGLTPGYSPEWVADFLFRHFRGVVVDWLLRQDNAPLLPKLEQDYQFFEQIFKST